MTGIPALSRPLAAAIAPIAARQHGVVARRQLLALGMARSTIVDWVRAGHLHRLHQGVYAVGHPRVGTEGAWMAAVLACGDRAVLSHSTAAQLWRLIERIERVAMHVSIPRRGGARPPGLVVHRSRNLTRGDVTRRGGIPATTATRTVWDLAATASPKQLRRAFERAESRGLLDRRRLRRLAAAAPSHRGSGLLRTLLDDRPLPLSETRSWLEGLLLTICADHGLPLPAVNVPLLGYEVDFLWPQHRFVVEADGGSHRGPQRDRDNERDIRLGRAGYLVRRYSSLAMGDEGAVAEEIVEILAERAPAATRSRSGSGS